MANETILIVEDSLLNRKLVETILRAHGYRLLTAVDGGEGVEIALREQPALILMDIQLPTLNGYEATRELKARPETAHIPVVALTAHAMAEERKQAFSAGCSGYITKPIDTRTFPDLIRRYLAGETDRCSAVGLREVGMR